MTSPTWEDLAVGQKWYLKEEDVHHCVAYPGEGGYIEITFIRSDTLGYITYQKNGTRHSECCSCYGPQHLLTQVGKDPMMLLQTLSAAQEAAIKEPERTMLEAGVLDSQLQLTSTGAVWFNRWLFETNKAAFAKEVTEKVAETKAELKKAKKV